MPRNEKRVDKNHAYVETIHKSLLKICAEVDRENDTRALLEAAEFEQSEAQGTVEVIQHVMDSNQGIQSAVAGVREGAENARKTKTLEAGLDIVQVMNKGADLAETGNGHNNIFALNGQIQESKRKVSKPVYIYI